MKRVVLDIETQPSIVHAWRLFDVNVSLNQVVQPGRVISWAAKEVGAKKIDFASEYHDGREEFAKRTFDLLDGLDVAIHWNGTSFDIPHLQGLILQAGLPKPAPFLQVDLLRVVRRQFKFTSNKLDFVSQALGVGAKTHHEGHGLWVRCMEGDPKAWALMKRYNVNDVKITEGVYHKLLPWITNHPSVPLHAGSDEEACGSCGGTSLQRRGQAVTLTGVYGRLQCQGCGSWSRYTKRELGAPVVGLR